MSSSEEIKQYFKSRDIIQLSKNPTKLLIWVIIILASIWLIQHMFTTVLIFSFAILIAYLIVPIASDLSSKKIPGTRVKIPWGVATSIIYLVILGILILASVMLIPILIAQVNSLISLTPTYLNKTHQLFDQLLIRYHRLILSKEVDFYVTQYGGAFLREVSPTFSIVARSLAGGILKVFSAALILLSAFIFSFYIVLEHTKILRSLLDMFPENWRKDTEVLMHDMGVVVGGFIRGQLILSVIITISSYCLLMMLRLFGVHYEYILITALAAGLLNPIPFIGAWIPRILALIIAYFEVGGVGAVAVFAALSAVGLVTDNFVLPLVIGKGVGISPLMILLAVFAGGELFGFWGLLLSVPAAAIIRLLFFYLQKRMTI